MQSLIVASVRSFYAMVLNLNFRPFNPSDETGLWMILAPQNYA
jgi:hypothetical protein